MIEVLLFAKAPRPGAVKTRLARDIGAGPAAAVYRAVGARVAARVAEAHPLTVWYDPPDALGEMRAWLGDHEFLVQTGPDLGARLSHAFGVHFGRGAAPVCAIGADTPGVDAQTIARAVEALQSAEVVVGPAVDGGYYLIGLTRPCSVVFAGVPWGTDHVLQVTLENCRRYHLSTALLEPLRDVDTSADLEVLGLERP